MRLKSARPSKSASAPNRRCRGVDAVYLYSVTAIQRVLTSQRCSAWAVSILTSAALVVLAISISLGSSVMPSTLSSLTRNAGVVFGGTVSRIESGWDTGHKTILTHVTFSHLEYVKGARGRDRLTLNLRGGFVGNEGIVVDGQPQFHVGARYIVLSAADLGSERNAYLPIAGLFQGFFPVHLDSATGLQVVHDWGLRPIAAIREGRIVVVSKHDNSQAESRIRIYNVRDSRGQSLPESLVHPIGESKPQGVAGVTPRAPVEVVERNLDPKTRVTEREFLAALRALDLQK